MKYKKPRERPEDAAAKTLMNYMRARGWYSKKMHGNLYQKGIPDYYCHHHLHGHRWVETKAPGEKLRASQRKVFSELSAAGDKVYVLENIKHYERLFEKENWRNYL